PSNAALGNLCAARRLFPLLGAVGLLAGMAAGAWLLGQLKHLKRPLADLGSALPQELGAVAACGEGDEEEPVVPRAPGAASFRINSENSLLEVQVESRPGWLLACHERWDLSLGTRLCRQLGHLRWALPCRPPCPRSPRPAGHGAAGGRGAGGISAPLLSPLQGDAPESRERDGRQGGRDAAVRPDHGRAGRPPARHVAGQVRAAPGRQGSLRRGAAETHIPGSGTRCLSRVLLPRRSRCDYRRRRRQVSGWLVFAGVITHSSVGQEAGAPVEKIIYHSLYDDRSLDYDIALMKLKVPLNFSDAVGAVCLPPSRQDLLHGTRCWVSGWGYTSPDQAQVTETLKEALVPLIGTRRCNSSCMYGGELSARMLCAGYPRGQVDACQGDSGGPLVCRDGSTWRLVGIVSWGQGCGEPNHPGVYTNVAQLLPWIYQVTEVTWS
ncbi:TMPS5 protease, partial [Casuarius casuarius]|nr:TMPS5 protease [Casuarius casuarius]